MSDGAEPKTPDPSTRRIWSFTFEGLPAKSFSRICSHASNHTPFSSWVTTGFRFHSGAVEGPIFKAAGSGVPSDEIKIPAMRLFEEVV